MKNFLIAHKVLWIEIGILFIVSLLPLYWFSGGYVLLGHDSGFRLDYQTRWYDLFYSWDPKINFGVDGSVFKGYLIGQFPELALAFITHSFAYGEAIALVFWFFVMGFGMYIFLKRLFPEPYYMFFRLFTSIFYMYNFFILNAWLIGERAKFSLYAALPLGLLLIYNVFVLNKSIIYNGVLFGMLYFLLNGAGILPLFGGTILCIGTAFVVFTIYRIRMNGWKEIIFLCKALLAFAVSFFILNAYYLIPNIYLLFNNYSTALAHQGGIEGLISWERSISGHASVSNLLRLQGMPDWYDNASHPYAKFFISNPVLIVLSFIPISLIFLGLIFDRYRTATKNQQRMLWFLTVVLPIGLFFTMGTHPPTGIFYEFAMKKIPGFVMFRSSFYKFAPALWMPVIVLSGYFLNQFFVRRIKSLYLQIGVGTFLIIGLFLYHFPYFSAQPFEINKNFQTRVKVPEYLKDLPLTLNQLIQDDEAVLIVPKLNTSYLHLPVDAYTWGYFSLDVLPRIASNRRFIANDSSMPLVENLYSALYKGDLEHFWGLAGILHIRYILWRGDIATTDAVEDTDALRKIQATLNEGNGFTRVFATGPWTLFKLMNSYYEPSVFATTSINAYVGDDIQASSLMDLFSGLQRKVLIKADSQSLDQTNLTDRLFIASECLMCRSDEFNKLTDAIILPNQRLKPNSVFYFLQQKKDEQSLRVTRDNPEKRIDADLALSQNKLSYAKNLGFSVYLSQYVGFIEDVFESWNTLRDKERNNYAIRIYAYITAQERVIESLEHFLNKDEVMQKLREIKLKLENEIWMSEGLIYRYDVVLDVDDIYTIFTNSESSQLSSIIVDTQSIQLSDQIRLSKGYHRVEIHLGKDSIGKIPNLFFAKAVGSPIKTDINVTFDRINPTQYNVHVVNNTSTPFLLGLKEQYDPRWRASIKSSKHVMVDGFSNGWIIDTKLTSFDIILDYQPQDNFYIGLTVTGVSIMVVCLYLVLHGYIFRGQSHNDL